jgi:hypothetical protein
MKIETTLLFSLSVCFTHQLFEFVERSFQQVSDELQDVQKKQLKKAPTKYFFVVFS